MPLPGLDDQRSHDLGALPFPLPELEWKSVDGIAGRKKAVIAEEDDPREEAQVRSTARRRESTSAVANLRRILAGDAL